MNFFRPSTQYPVSLLRTRTCPTMVKRLALRKDEYRLWSSIGVITLCRTLCAR